VAVAKLFAYDRAVFAFDQGVVIAAAGAGLGEFVDLEFVEQRGDLAVDVRGTVVGVEAPDDKGKGEDEPLQDREQEAFADALDGGDELELGDLVDGVDEVQAFEAVQIALVNAVDAQIAGLALWPGFAALADGDGGGACLADGDPLALIGFGLAESVEVTVGNRRQARIARIAENPEGAFAEFLGGRP